MGACLAPLATVSRDDVVLGIDLGTTNSVVAVADGSEARVLTTELGARLIPSVVSFKADGRIVVGEEARERRLIDAAHTVYSVKRLIGRPFKSPEVRRAQHRFAFELAESANGGVVVDVRGETYTLTEISAFVLREVKRIAELSLGRPVTRAVITVPANFNELQRSATKAAGRVAGLEVLRIINEPTAAALAYGLGKERAEQVAVFDLGGGTFDLTLLELEGDVFEVRGTAGDSFLGGDDLELVLAERMCDAFLEKFHWDPRQDDQAFERLRAAAEWAKCQLSEDNVVKLTVEELTYAPDGRALDLEFQVDRRTFEDAIRPLLARAFDVCQEALRAAGMKANEVQSVVLVGGSTRTPLVRQMVAHYFGRKPHTALDPDLVVAQGAAIHGHSLRGQGAPKTSLGKIGIKKIARGELEKLRAAREARQAALPKQPAFVPKPPAFVPKPPAFVPKPPAFVPKPPPARPLGSTPPAPAPYAATDALEASRPLASVEPPGSLEVPSPASPVGNSTSLGAGPSLTGLDEPLSQAPGLVGLDDPLIDVTRPPRSLDGPPPGDTSLPPALSSRDLPRTDVSTSPAVPHLLDLDDPLAELGHPGIGGAGARVAPTAAASRERPVPSAQAQVLVAPSVAVGVPTQGPASVLAEASTSSAVNSAGLAGRTNAAEVSSDPTRIADMGALDLTSAARGCPDGRSSGFSDDTLPASLDFESTSDLPTLEGGAGRGSVGFDSVDFDSVDFDSVGFETPAVSLSSEPDSASLKMPDRAAPLLMDVTPHSLGIETVGGVCQHLIRRNAPIPSAQGRIFGTASDGQQVVTLRVCQGESRVFEENELLGEVQLTGLRAAPRGHVKIDVAFLLDASGTLDVRAVDADTGAQQTIRINLLGGSDEAEIERMRERHRAMLG